MAKKVLTRKRGDWWSYRFEGASVGGARQWITQSHFETEDEAYKAGLAAYNEYQNSGLKITPTELSVADFLDYWIREYCQTNLKDTTTYNYQKKIKNLIAPAIGKYKLRSLQTSTVQRLINDLFNAGYSRNTLAGVKGILSKSMKYAKTQKFIRENPMYEVDLPLQNARPKIKTRKKERAYLDKDTVQRIFQRFPEGHPMYIPLILGYRCGLRLGEAFALQWRDIDFSARTLTVQRQVQYCKRSGDKPSPNRTRASKNDMYFSDPKYNSVRTIEIDTATLDLLRRTKKRQSMMRLSYGEFYTHYYVTPERQRDGDPEPFILNEDGIGEEVYMVNVNDNGSMIRPRSMTECCRAIHGYKNVQKDGVVRKIQEDPISETFDYHSLRHTHCTELLLAGVAPKAVQLRLGHKDIKTTLNIYDHLTEEMKADTANKLEKLYAAE